MGWTRGSKVLDRLTSRGLTIRPSKVEAGFEEIVSRTHGGRRKHETCREEGVKDSEVGYVNNEEAGQSIVRAGQLL